MAGYSDEDTSIEGGNHVSLEISPELKDQIKKKLIEKYFQELPEHSHTRESLITYVKYMIKNIQLEKMTQMGDSVESKLLMDWVLENEPLILIEISKFWLYNSFSLSLDDYQDELSFILKTFESNFNLIIYSVESLQSWINILTSLPCYPQDQSILNEHILFILSKIPTNLIS